MGPGSGPDLSAKWSRKKLPPLHQRRVHLVSETDASPEQILAMTLTVHCIQLPVADLAGQEMVSGLVAGVDT